MGIKGIADIQRNFGIIVVFGVAKSLKIVWFITLWSYFMNDDLETTFTLLRSKAEVNLAENLNCTSYVNFKNYS